MTDELSWSVIGAGTIFRLGKQKLVKNYQDNQIQNITLCSYVFLEKGICGDGVQSGPGQSPEKPGSFLEFLY